VLVTLRIATRPVAMLLRRTEILRCPCFGLDGFRERRALPISRAIAELNAQEWPSPSPARPRSAGSARRPGARLPAKSETWPHRFCKKDSCPTSSETKPRPRGRP